MVTGSEERRSRLDRLRKKGQFKWNQDETLNKGELSTCRRPNKKYGRVATDQETCANCLGSYSAKSLRNHFNKCTNNQFAGERVAKEKSRRIEARVHVEACSELVDIVFPSLRQTEAALSIRFDWIIIIFANNLCFNFSPHDQLSVAQKHLREAGHLLIAARSITSEISDFASMYNVKHCNVVISAIRVIAKYDDKLKKFSSPGTAASLVTLVNNIGNCLSIEYMKLNDEDNEKAVARFLKVFQQDAKVKVNKMVTINQLEARRDKPEIIPSTDDVERLATYLDRERTACYKALSKQYSAKDWTRLVHLTSISLLVFNRKRVGDTQNLLVREYTNREIVNNTKTISSRNTQKISDDVAISRLKLRAKRYRTAPVLLKRSFEECLDLILHHRKRAGVPEHNQYLFGLPSKSGKIVRIRAGELLRQFADQCNAENPISLRGTHLRKHFATLCGTLDLSDNDVTNVAKFMGHSEKVHRDVYRHNALQQEVVKMSSLLNIAQGKTSAVHPVNTKRKRKQKTIVSPKSNKKRKM